MSQPVGDSTCGDCGSVIPGGPPADRTICDKCALALAERLREMPEAEAESELTRRWLALQE